MFVRYSIPLFGPSAKARKSIGVSKHVCIALTVTLMVMMSPIVIFINPQLDATGPISPARIDTSNYHSMLTRSHDTSNGESSPLASDSGPPTAQAALQIPRSFQSTDIVNSNGIYEITFITATSGAIKTIEMVFPAGTVIGPAGFIEKVGIGPGTFSKAGTTMTFNVQTPVNVPAGTFIRFELVNVKNPPTASSSLQVSITTKDNMGNIIDGPTPTAVYNIKQLGTAEIADSAISTPKIADDAILPQTIQQPSATINVPPQSKASATATCPSSHPTVTGGGFGVGVNQEQFMHASDSNQGNQWIVVMYNSHPSATLSFGATATCMAPMP
jgi:hypothetical protein